MTQVEEMIINGDLRENQHYKWHSTFPIHSLETSEDEEASQKRPCNTAGILAKKRNMPSEEEFDKMMENSRTNDTSSSGKITTALYSPQPSKFEMPNHPSYHGELSGEMAEARLRQSGQQYTYLTRFSMNSNTYTLSALNFHHKSVHFKLIVDNDRKEYTLQNTQKVFGSLQELLEFYQKNRLSPGVGTIGVPCLPPQLQLKWKQQKLPQQQPEQQQQLLLQQPQHIQQPQPPQQQLQQQTEQWQQQQTEQQQLQPQQFEQQPQLQQVDENNQQQQQQQQPQQAGLQQPQMQTPELELLRDTLRQERETQREFLNQLAGQQLVNQELLNKLSKSKCTIL